MRHVSLVKYKAYNILILELKSLCVACSLLALQLQQELCQQTRHVHDRWRCISKS